ncbi:MAG: glycosyltransferase family 2 protein [Cyanobacteria bacterium]|nr:glycosyltransferase family 2 protein [Cyanobacteriota bacterium]
MMLGPLELLGVVVGAGAIAVALPIAVFAVECGAALWPLGPDLERSPAADDGEPARSPRLAILVPAHNEALTLGPTLAALRPELGPDDRLVVVADNCEDATADIAIAAGAIALERTDPIRRGKGYALDFGRRHLAQDPPAVVVVIDADCEVTPGAIARIAQLAAARQRPVQALYLMEVPPNPSPARRVSALAFAVKNWARPRGLRRLGLPCLLTGTGMAFPWAAIAALDLASGNLVEDMQMGIDLTIAGAPPLFCPQARVTSRLPSGDAAATGQRTRWEHGHLQTIRQVVPPLLGRAIASGRFDLLALALEISVPPLSLLVGLWLAIALLAGILGGIGGPLWPAAISATSGLALTLAVASAWWKFGRPFLPPQQILAIPLYLLGKIPLYLGFFKKPETQWVRTERDAPPPDGP